MHTDDVYYNFDLSDDKCAQFSERDYEVATYMALAFVNFARTGNPNINNSQVNIKSIFFCENFDFDFSLLFL
jgi:carboxylesterase type B